MAEKRKIRSEKDDAVSQEAVMALEKENRVAQYRGHIAKLISFIAICFSLFQLYTGIFGVLDAQLQRAVHLGFGLVLVFLLYPTRRAWLNRTSIHPLDAFLALLAASGPCISSRSITIWYCARAISIRWTWLSARSACCSSLKRRGAWSASRWCRWCCFSSPTPLPARISPAFWGIAA